jgi:hypothetical protein
VTRFVTQPLRNGAAIFPTILRTSDVEKICCDVLFIQDGGLINLPRPGMEEIGLPLRPGR